VQLIAAPGCDHVLIGLAAQLEARSGWKPSAPAIAGGG
jgi:hypothetical protein